MWYVFQILLATGFVDQFLLMWRKFLAWMKMR